MLTIFSAKVSELSSKIFLMREKSCISSCWCREGEEDEDDVVCIQIASLFYGLFMD
jgi:hypothetical protein